MQPWMWSVLAVAAVLGVIAVLVWRNINRCLVQRFDDEHDGAVGNVASLQNAPDARVRSARLQSRMLRSLSRDERAMYVTRWRQQQRQATTQPATALLEADELLMRLLDDVGYPTGGFALHAADLSAAHAAVVDEYRAARNVVLDLQLGLAGTHEIRHAIRRYGRVFECLAEADVSNATDETVA